MFIKFIVALIVLAVGVCSADTAVTAIADDVPHHEELGRRFARHFFNATSNTIKGTKAAVTGKLPLKKAALTANYFVSRQRVNGDCTGSVIAEIGYELDTCTHNGINPNPFAFACNQADGKTFLKKVNYDDNIFRLRRALSPAGCGFAMGEQVLNGDGSTCQTNEDYIPYRGYTTKTANCGVQPTYMNLDSHGIYTSYDAAYKYVPFGVCQLFVDYQNTPQVGDPHNPREPDENTRYYYIKMVSCDSATDIVTVHAFADPACSRKLYKTAFHMNEDPKFNGYAYDPEVGQMGTSGCVSGWA